MRELCSRIGLMERKKKSFCFYANAKKEYWIRKLTSSREPEVEVACKTLESIVEACRKSARRRVKENQFLYVFEEDLFKISDSLLTFYRRGRYREYREFYEELYLFVSSYEQSAYMPVSLLILYRYAQAVLCTGEPEQAMELYHDLLEHTDRMIGTDNTYGIMCWDRLGAAAMAAGKPEEAETAYKEALRIGERNFGLYSPLTLAVQHRLASVQSGTEQLRNRRDLFFKSKRLLGEEHPVTRCLQTEYAEKGRKNKKITKKAFAGAAGNCKYFKIRIK